MPGAARAIAAKDDARHVLDEASLTAELMIQFAIGSMLKNIYSTVRPRTTLANTRIPGLDRL